MKIVQQKLEVNNTSLQVTNGSDGMIDGYTYTEQPGDEILIHLEQGQKTPKIILAEIVSKTNGTVKGKDKIEYKVKAVQVRDVNCKGWQDLVGYKNPNGNAQITIDDDFKKKYPTIVKAMK